MNDSIRKPDEDVRPVTNRREFIRNGVMGAASISFAALLARQSAHAAELPYSDDYGPLELTRDQVTGLKLIALPRGFIYFSYGWTGQPMEDGQRTPAAHDGMGVVAAKGDEIMMVRNHEQGTGGIAFDTVAYDRGYGFGGTTNVAFDHRRGMFLRSFPSLTGTVRNCAGGRTPWGSWLTCEESGDVSPAGVRHGWIFEVPGYGMAWGQPLRAMGKSEWEAVAVDPVTSYVYQTEDVTPGGFYKFVPTRFGRLERGGELFALKVVGADTFNFSGLNGAYVDFAPGTTWNVEWVRVTDVEAINGRIYNSAPGRACFARPEGCFYDSGKIYFTCTSGGVARQGQVFVYDPRRETLTMVFNSTGAGIGNTECSNPDNIAVSPRGGIMLCEDGGNNIQRLRGLTQSGGTFLFAENRVVLDAAQIAEADAALKAGGNISNTIRPGTYTDNEWCGACFYENWMFVNLQTPGITFAITGPWDNGAL